MPKDHDHEFKIILLGESGVGKTSLTIRYTDGVFKSNSVETVVANFFSKVVVTQGVKSKLFIWDTAGQERYKSMVMGYYRNVDGVLLVYDVTNIMTFNQLSSWLKEVRDISGGATALIVGNKSDHPDCRHVSRSVVRRFARDEGLEFMESSAKTGQNIEQIFEYLTLKILQDKGILPLSAQPCLSHASDPELGTEATTAQTTNSQASVIHDTSTHALQDPTDLNAHSSLPLNAQLCLSPAADPELNPEAPTVQNTSSEASFNQDTSTHALQDSIDLNTPSSLPQSSIDVPEFSCPSYSKEPATTLQNDRAISETTFGHETFPRALQDSPDLPPIVRLSGSVAELFVEKRRKLSVSSDISLLLDADDLIYRGIKLHDPTPNVQKKPPSKCFI